LEELARMAALGRNASRGPIEEDPTLLVSLDRLDPDDFALFRAMLSQIETARTLGDGAALARLEAKAKGLGQLDARLRAYLAKAAEAAKTDVPAGEPADADTVVVAAAHAAAAKDVSSNTVRTKMGAAKKPPAKVGKAAKDDGDPPAKGRDDDGAKGGAGPGPRPPGFAGIVAAIGDAPDDLKDEAFEGRIDLGKVGAAWARGDASALADLAFRLTEEERVLRRPHKHVPAKVLFQGALGLAVANNDVETIERLEQYLKESAPAAAPAEKAAREDLLVRLDAGKKLARASRKGEPPLTVRIDLVEPEAFEAFRSLLDRIRSARATGDAASLVGIEGGLDAVVELDAGQRAYLRRAAAEARRMMPAPHDAGADVLRRLAAASRGGKLTGLNQKVYTAASELLGMTAGDGSSRAFVAQVLRAAGAKADGNTWGQPVSADQAQPGDVVLLRGVKLGLGGVTHSYQEQTAVISQVSGAGRYWIYVPASAGKRLVVLASLDLSQLAAGEVAFFRPAEK
jgi:hypothetical protein